MKNFMLSLVVSAAVAFAVVKFMPAPDAAPQKESAYERVIRTGTLRCGYALYEPLLGKDPNTGALRGVFYDLMNEMGRELNLKIEWATEVGYGEIEQGFQTGKYDMFCNGVTFTPKRAKFSMSTTPIYFNEFSAWVRADDHRFDGGLTLLNAPEVRLAVRDGDINDAIARKNFPKAQIVATPQLVDDTQMLIDVQTGKADAAFFEKAFGYRYMAKNPGKIRPLLPEQPVDSNAVGMMLPPGEAQMKNMIDTTLMTLILNGTVKRLIDRDAGPDYSYWRVARPYER